MLYQKATSIKPDYVEAHYSNGNAYQSLGNLEEAIQSYERVLELKPSIRLDCTAIWEIYIEKLVIMIRL